MNFIRRHRLPETLDEPHHPKTASILAWVVMTARRRRLLSFMAGLPDDATVPVGRLADILSKYAYDPPIRASDRKVIYVNLIQDDLPNLDRHGVVEYDDVGKTVTRGETFDLARETAEAVDAIARSAWTPELPDGGGCIESAEAFEALRRRG